MKLNDELQRTIVSGVLQGNYLETVAQANGISPSTLHRWLRLGRAGKEPYQDFECAVAKARAQAEMQLVSVAMEGDGVGRAAMEFLARTRSRRFCTRITTNVRDELDSFLSAAEEYMGEELFQKLLEAREDWIQSNG
jgi:transposase-like protein